MAEWLQLVFAGITAASVAAGLYLRLVARKERRAFVEVDEHKFAPGIYRISATPVSGDHRQYVLARADVRRPRAARLAQSVEKRSPSGEITYEPGSFLRRMVTFDAGTRFFFLSLPVGSSTSYSMVISINDKNDSSRVVRHRVRRKLAD